MNIQELIKMWEHRPPRAFGALSRILNQSEELQKELCCLTPFLDDHYENVSVQQRFYHVWFDYFEIEKCPYCNSPREFSKKNKFSSTRSSVNSTNPINYYQTCPDIECKKKYNADRTKDAMLKKYGVENISQTPEWHDKIKITNQKKYGCDYQTQSENFKIKSKETWKEKYGVDHHTQSQQSKDKKIRTVKSKYGVDHVLQNANVMNRLQATNTERYGGVSSMCSEETKDKAKATFNERYDVNWYVQSDEFKVKVKKTLLERYGVEHIMQYTPVFQNQKKSSFKWKKFMFPSGRMENIQGYEGFAINELLDAGYDESDIIISNLDIETFAGKVWYNDSIGKRRKYYPDIYIKSENKIIEVKSEYTLKQNLQINLLKQKAVEQLGIAFEFWIYDNEGIKI